MFGGAGAPRKKWQALEALAWKARESEQPVTAQRSKEMMGHKKTEGEGGWKQTNSKVRKFVCLFTAKTNSPYWGRVCFAWWETNSAWEEFVVYAHKTNFYMRT